MSSWPRDFISVSAKATLRRSARPSPSRGEREGWGCERCGEGEGLARRLPPSSTLAVRSPPSLPLPLRWGRPELCRAPVAQGRRRWARAVAIVASASLGGCVSLLPKQPPAQLYQFGQTPPPAASSSVSAVGGGQGLGVVLSQVTLPRAAQGDGILTARGDEAAYIAGARWLTPAVLMFQEDVQNAFATRATGVRLLDRGQIGAATALLRLDVTEFDARYDPAAGAAPPTVVVSLRATLTRADGRALLQQVFTERRPAAQDRVSAIVSAYDAAVQGVMARAVDWTQAQTPLVAADLDPATPIALPPSAAHTPGGLPQ